MIGKWRKRREKQERLIYSRIKIQFRMTLTWIANTERQRPCYKVWNLSGAPSDPNPYICILEISDRSQWSWKPRLRRLGTINTRRLRKLGLLKFTKADFLPREVVSYSKETQTPLVTYQSAGLWTQTGTDVLGSSCSPASRFGEESHHQLPWASSLQTPGQLWDFSASIIIVHHVKRWTGWSISWNKDCQEKYQ